MTFLIVTDWATVFSVSLCTPEPLPVERPKLIDWFAECSKASFRLLFNRKKKTAAAMPNKKIITGRMTIIPYSLERVLVESVPFVLESFEAFTVP